MWVLIHVKGCGGACFKRVTKPKKTDPVTPELIRNLDGSQPLATDPVICQTCGLGLGISDLYVEYFVEENSGSTDA